MQLAPIILFTYNRPWHTEQTLSALKTNSLAGQSKLYVYCDGPKTDASSEDLEQIRAVRNLVKSIDYFDELVIVERAENYGLAENVIDGVTKIVNEHGKIIVLEDDLVTSPYFLTYCNEALELYIDSPNVYAINGYQFPLNIQATETFLSPQATSSWGWATWKDRWKVFDRNNIELELIQDHKLIRERFDISDNKKSEILSNKNSWAIIWYYSVFVRNGLGLFPTKALVENIGFDGSGVHCSEIDYSQNLHMDYMPLVKAEKINLSYYSLVLDWFTSKKVPRETGIKFRIKKYLKYLFRNDRTIGESR